MTTNLRFGVVVSDSPSWEDLKTTAQTAEALGYSSLVMPDHLRRQLPPLVTLSAIAAVTSRIKLGTMTLASAIRDPLMIAREAAMIQFVSKGRFELGLGAGWLRADFRATGSDLPDNRMELINRFEESLTVITRLFDGETLNIDGRFHRLENAYVWPMAERPPIVIGGGSPLILALAARFGDAISILPRLTSGLPGAHLSSDASLESFQVKADRLVGLLGDRWGTTSISTHVFFVHIGPNKDHYLDFVATKLPLPRQNLDASPLVLAGEVDEVCRTIAYRQQLLGLNYLIIKADAMHQFAPVVAAMAR